MRLALSLWNGRIAPVFDMSRHLELFEVSEGQVVARHPERIEADDPLQRTERLQALGVSTLLCGAVSQPLAGLLEVRGITVWSFLCGDAEQVLAAFLAGRLPDPMLSMPGCCGRRRNCRRAGACSQSPKTVHPEDIP